jgi:cytochrome c biogenesis protein CcdA
VSVGDGEGNFVYSLLNLIPPGVATVVAPAFTIGLLATLNPCVLPLYPGYLAYLAANGKSNSQIALQLGVSTRAVELHLTRIYEKLGVSSRAEAIVKLVRLFEK